MESFIWQPHIYLKLKIILFPERMEGYIRETIRIYYEELTLA